MYVERMFVRVLVNSLYRGGKGYWPMVGEVVGVAYFI